jgi:subtilisin
MSIVSFGVTDGVSPLPNVEVTVIVSNLAESSWEVVKLETSAAGQLTYKLPPDTKAHVALVKPQSSYWPMQVSFPFAPVVICPALPADGPIGWWHKKIGQTSFDSDAGKGIRLGVVDSGLAGHVALQSANLVGSFLGAKFSTPGELAMDDHINHGTHVAGLIGAQTINGHYTGVAPGATLFVARVFEHNDAALSADIADAIEVLAIDREVDVINLSLGTLSKSEIVADAVSEAYDNGTLCIAAAGNVANEPINFPAALDEVVAVAAVGRLGWGPKGCHARSFEPDAGSNTIGNEELYLAAFSARGLKIDVAAPGVGLISAVPSGGAISSAYAAMSGTSMAAPIVSAFLACKLSENEEYVKMPKNRARAAKAKEVLMASLRDIGLSREMQGSGFPTL